VSKSYDDIAFEINNTEIKLIFVTGSLSEFAAYNFATDYNYSYLDFDMFLKDNNIDSNHFKASDSARNTKIMISIDAWTQKIAYREQKPTVIIDGFNPKKLPDLLTKGLLMQELLHISKNSSKLKTNLVFFINTNNGPIEQQIMSKIIANSLILSID